MKLVLYIATIISILTYSFWTYLPKGSFYYGNALFITLLCTYLFLTDKKSFIKFFLFELSLFNFVNELFLDPKVLSLTEALLIVIIPLIWYIKNGKHNRVLGRD